jgi:anthranilate synthase/aminodeoxychorismate synthase-like glutamine amidotransferase
MLHLAPILNNILDMKAPTVLMLDNFDSFTYNLVDFFRQLGCEVVVYRNTVEPEALAQVEFDLLVLSPGPSVPRNAGNMMRIIERFYQEKPILGVCLGHQALIEFFGGTLANIAPVHGKAVSIEHDGRGIFTGLEPGCEVARYHSWAGDTIPPEFEVSARSSDGVVMAVRHKRLPIEGIQFHPESVLSMKNQAGMRMLRNVVEGRMASGNRIYYELSQTLQTGAPIHPEALRSFLTRPGRRPTFGRPKTNPARIPEPSTAQCPRVGQFHRCVDGIQFHKFTNPQLNKSPNNQIPK